jgi:hypothetical protein
MNLNNLFTKIKEYVNIILVRYKDMVDPIEPVNSNLTIKEWLQLYSPKAPVTDKDVNTFLNNEMTQFNVTLQQANSAIEREKEYFKSALDDPEAPSS